jgi:putative DNA primase/helicase
MTTPTLHDFITALYPFVDGDSLIELRALPSKKQLFIQRNDSASLQAFQRLAQNVYFGVATRRTAENGTAENLAALTTLFTDIDFKQIAEADARQRLQAFPLSPSIVVHSGGGLHPYWCLREAIPLSSASDRQAATAILRRLAIHLGGDLSVAEVARVLRLPGTLNRKYDPPRAVTIELLDATRRYNPSDFDEWLPADTTTTGRQTTPLDLSGTITAGHRNDTLYRTGRALKAKQLPDAVVATTLTALNAKYTPPLDATELDGLIRQVTTQPDRADFVPDVVIEVEATAPITTPRRAVLTRLSAIDPQDIEFIWEKRVGRARVNCLVGDPGLGKSWISIDIAARVSRGAPWPDGGNAPCGDVIILSAEDHAADTIRPRADALGADVTRIHVLSAIRTGDRDDPFSLVTDLSCLETAIVETSAVLVIIDPLSAYLGTRLDSYKDSHVRSVLGPLAALAERTNVAILSIMHLSKGTDRKALYRALGSVAFVAAARLVLAVAPHPDDDDARVLVPVKQNICAPATTLAYRLTDGRLRWDADPVPDVTADQLLATVARDLDTSRDADAWLREVLQNGPVLSKDLEREARQVGIATRTLFRAKARLRIDAVRIGGATRGAGAWYWSLPVINTANALCDPVAALIPDAKTGPETPSGIKAATAHTEGLTVLTEDADEVAI